MSEPRRKRMRGTYVVLTLALIALALVSVGGVFYYRQADTLKTELNNSYNRAFHNMADFLSDIDTTLKKTMLAQDAGQMSSLSSKLYMQAESAKACLSELPAEGEPFHDTSKFLSQVGDYAAYLSQKMIGSEGVSEEEYQNLEKLSAYAEAVSEEFQNLEGEIYAGTVSVNKLSSTSFPLKVQAAGKTFESGMKQLEALPQEYPALIYDGPFSDHLETTRPKMLEGEMSVSRLAAEDTVREMLGEERARVVEYVDDGEGKIETYLFSGEKNGRSISMEVTKKGGYALWMLDSREVKEERLNISQASAAGETFLLKHGYPSMKSSYYEVGDHIATINYAYVQDGVVMYPDLIKVKIALDNGEVLGFEAEGYLMCHETREIPEDVIGESAAREKAGTHLKVDTINMAYIPLDSGREVFCYELKGKLGKNNFLIYVNAKTGKEERILMLLESERGILTV